MAVERYFHGLWPNHSLDALAAAAATFGLYVCLAFVAAAWIRRRPRGAFVPFAIGAAVSAAAVFLTGLAYQEQRPFVVLGVSPIVPHGVDNAFPSDHSAAAAYAATVGVFIDPVLGGAAWVATIALGAGRSYCLLHTPVDVIAGWLLGALPALAAGMIWRKRWITHSSPRRSN